MQAGNDFLPNVPSLDIYDWPKSALDTLLAAYKAMMSKSAQPHLCKNGVVDARSLKALLVRLAQDEQPALSRRQVRYTALPHALHSAHLTHLPQSLQ